MSELVNDAARPCNRRREEPIITEDTTAVHAAKKRLTDRLAALDPVIGDLGRRFAGAGYELALVGGSVRDAFLGRPTPDLDLTTNARPDDVLRVIDGWADAHWEIGREFGTIGLRKNGEILEITTYRAEKYQADSRKPEVVFGDTLDGDLTRRDFTVGAMAVRLPELTFVDPSGGLGDLGAGVLRTPGLAADSFSDDPLRMLRAARFVSQLGFGVHPSVGAAMTDMAARIEIVSAERVQAELVKLMCGKDPRAGIELLVDTGLADYVLPEVAALVRERDEHHRHKDVYQHTLTVLEQAIDLEGPDTVEGPDFIVRFAALMHDVGKPATRRFEPGGRVSFHHHDVVGAKLTAKRMKQLRFDKDTTKAVARLVELHLRFFGYGDAGWTDSAVRRYVTDAGPLLGRLHILIRSDVTTRNRRKADRLAHAYDDLERRIGELREKEEMDAVRPDLDGRSIMTILDIPPGPAVGQAYRFLLDLRMENGPLGRDEAERRLKEWWASR
ncbi:CCA tRNA nucleotidyltransferase [Spelaeicoccus albus]|uniref:Poly(A) polymerase n=1 Tax=Spelaeicoccus albus TaxID=1280376 RepID=A0A7Z0A8X9_9MICO|nr:poly(A) polymerase [Spelaeicoccus albus]